MKNVEARKLEVSIYFFAYMMQLVAITFICNTFQLEGGDPVHHE